MLYRAVVMLCPGFAVLISHMLQKKWLKLYILFFAISKNIFIFFFPMAGIWKNWNFLIVSFTHNPDNPEKLLKPDIFS